MSIYFIVPYIWAALLIPFRKPLKLLLLPHRKLGDLLGPEPAGDASVKEGGLPRTVPEECSLGGGLANTEDFLT